MELPVIFNDRYQLIKKIGEGGLAEVYQTQDMALGRMVAAKVLRPQYSSDPSFLVNFHREAQNAAKLSDSYIVAVYDFGQDKGRPYIVMEWVAGSDLRSAINKRGTLPIDQVVDLTIQICSAVGTAHRAGIVHGDLKPGNILLTTNQQAKVADFGLARALGESAMDEGEVVWGTPAYFAPEQASGDRVLPATDVYAIGIILYEMLTGRVPFVGIDDQDVARKQLYEAHIPIDQLDPTIPEPLARIVDASLAKNPNERFLTADHLREALIMYKQGGLSNASRQTPTPVSSVIGSPVQGTGYAGMVPPPPPPPRHYDEVEPETAQQSKGLGIDVIMLLLGVIAMIAVIGLIPLFVAVYQAYASQSGGDNNPAPTLAPGQVRMPDLVGEEEAVARSTLAELGLTLTVEGEEPHPVWPPFTIIRQSISPGDGATPNSDVKVVLSQGPALLELPNVTGLSFEEAEQRLINLDMVVQKFEDWNTETPGQVVSQDPPPKSLVASRTLVTLGVSSGARVPIGANLGGQISLEAYDLPRLQFKPGVAIGLTFFWKALTPPDDNYNLFINLTTTQGGIVSQIEGPPIKSTNSWGINEIIVDPYQLAIPVTTAPGEYQVRVGLYNPNSQTRLPIVEPGRGQQDNLGALILKSVQVVP
ncbi:MAG: protein kinase, partial [Chloroflexota bacterium]